MTISASTAFERFTAVFLEAYYQSHPHRAAGLGLHAFDGRVPDYNRRAIEARIAALRDFQRQLAAIDRAYLSPLQALDYRQLDLAIQQELFDWEDVRWWRRNPMFYSDALDVSGYIKRSYAPLDQRVRAMIAHERRFPEIIAVAQSNLLSELPAPFIDTALDVYQGLVTFLEDDLPVAVRPVGDPGLLGEFEQVNRAAISAVRDFVGWLRDELRPKANHDFAIGERLFRRMLWVGEMVDTPLDQLLVRGQAELARVQAEFAATAARIAPGRSPAEVMKSLAANHPSTAELVPAARSMLEDLRQFIVDRGLVTVPSDERCLVEETPAFMRWAFAMLDSAGVFEPEGTESYYYVTPPESDWPPEKQEEWLTKFDYYTLRDVCIHEAWPGHYLHNLHFRRGPTTVGKVFGAYSFWEGWAHYVEQMMLDEGYGDGDPRLRLVQLAEALLRCCRYIVAIKLHTQDWTVEQATRFIMDNAYMEETPARQEAVRGTFDPGFLNYTLGKLMLLKLRDDYRARSEGGRATTGATTEGHPYGWLREFHDRFLSYGAPPIPLVRELMLGDASGAVL
jgi:uncharacterized protein (DUF885 family)